MQVDPYYTASSMSAKCKCTYICITTVNISMYKQTCIMLHATTKILAGGNVVHKQCAGCAQTVSCYLKAGKKERANTIKASCIEPYKPAQYCASLNMTLQIN